MELILSTLPTLLSCSSWSEAHGFLGREFDLRETSTHYRLKQQFQIQNLHLLSQVHGTEIIEVCQSQPIPAADRPEADGWILHPGTVGAFGIKTADCTPLLIRAQASSGIFWSALHCGWRSAIAGILPRALLRLQEIGCESFEVAIGPSARACCYQIGDDVREQFAQQLPDAAERNMVLPEDRLDLERFLRIQIARIPGISTSVVSTPYCTICDLRFFSFRREKALAGRQLSYVIPSLGS